MTTAERTCPSAESLTAYLDGQLTAPESNTIKAHVVSCGVCDTVLERMKLFENPSTPDFPEAEWRGIERGLQRDFRKSLAELNPPVKRPRGWAWSPALAWSLVVLLVYPAWRGLQPAKPAANLPQAPSVAVAPLPVSELPVLRVDDSRGAGSTSPSFGSAPQFLLSFFVPVRAAARLDIDILDARGRTVVHLTNVTSSDAKGNFSLLCQRPSFPKGDYRVVLTEAGTGRKVQVPFRIS